MSTTSSRVKYEVPQFPVAMFLSQFRYWMGTGWSSPYLALRRAMSSDVSDASTV